MAYACSILPADVFIVLSYEPSSSSNASQDYERRLDESAVTIAPSKVE